MTGTLQMPISPECEDTARQIVDAGLKVNRALGPGLLESAYEHCLAHELTRRGLTLSRQTALPITYEDEIVEAGYRIDMLVSKHVIVEIKAVDKILPLHEAQLLTYLKLSSIRLGLLLNFNVALFKQGIRRIAF